MSWWDARLLLRLGRWSWPATAARSGAFEVAEVAVLGGGVLSTSSSGPGGGGGGGGGTGNTHGDAAAGGDARPCLACVSADGEVRVLRLGADGAEELHRAAGAAGVPGARAGVLTVPSPSRHQFVLVRRCVVFFSSACVLGVRVENI